MSDKTPLQSLVACGTKLWLDSVDPKEVAANRALGATGATSNPIIIADLIKTGRFDEPLSRLHQGRPRRRGPRLAADRQARPPGARKSSCPSGSPPRATTARSASSWTRCSKT